MSCVALVLCSDPVMWWSGISLCVVLRCAAVVASPKRLAVLKDVAMLLVSRGAAGTRRG